MNYFIDLLPGLLDSLRITAVVLIVGLPLGLVGGLLMHSLPRWAGLLILAVTEIGRGFPALVTLYIAYFGLPAIGIILHSFAAVVLSFAFTTACYTAEIFRASIAAVPQAQWEAGRALGLSRRIVVGRIVVPQALRQATVPILAFCIIIFQGSALAYSVGEPELLSRAYSAGTLSFSIMPYLLAASVLYLVVVLLFQLLVSWSTTHRNKPPRISANPKTTSISQ